MCYGRIWKRERKIREKIFITDIRGRVFPAFTLSFEALEARWGESRLLGRFLSEASLILFINVDQNLEL